MLTTWQQFTKRKQPAKLAAIAVFTNQFAVLLQSGVPLVKALALCSEQTESQLLNKILQQIVVSLTKGSTILNAFSAGSEYFSTMYLEMIHIGEVSGNLSKVLEDLARDIEHELKIQRQLISSLIYPAFVLLLCFLVIVLANFLVLPQIVTQLVAMHVPLPLPTKLLLVSFKLLHKSWFQIFIIVGIGIGIWQINKQLKVSYVRRWLDRTKLSLPVLGEIFKLLLLIKFISNLYILLEAGISLGKALASLIATETNTYFREICKKILKEVEEGKDLHQAMAVTGFFPGTILQLVFTGMETGELSKILVNLNNMLTNDFQRKLAASLTLLEPLAIGVMGALVGFVLIAIFMPLYQFVSSI